MSRPGHVIGLDLGRETDTPITIDGVPFRYVGDIKVDASPTGGMTVTVTFHAKRITGAEELAREARRDLVPNAQRPVTNGA